ncbi:MAG: bactofilin family protein [Longimicrobiales bacterium]
MLFNDMLFNKKPESSGSYVPAPGSRMPIGLPQLDQAPATARAQGGSATQSVIDAWLTINGNLKSEGDVRVEGQINGDIRCAHLVVGRDATLSGDVIAEEVVVRGKVKGSIRANRVILQDSACVESDIYHKMLCVDEGACFNGQSCHRQHPFQDGEAPSEPGGARKVVAGEPAERANGPGAEDALRPLGA